jgi:hypothetical protein
MMIDDDDDDDEDDDDDDDDDDDKPVWPTWAVGALFRRVRYVHINHTYVVLRIPCHRGGIIRIQ